MTGDADRTVLLPVPAGLTVPGSSGAPFRRAIRLGDLPPGALRRFSVGDLDVLVAHTPGGILATDDRCPHMAAPLSLGTLEGCVIACPLHQGAFDLATGETVRFPTTGGLDADGVPHDPWIPAGGPARPSVPDLKARARAATRVRRLRYYPVRIVDDWLEIAVPEG